MPAFQFPRAETAFALGAPKGGKKARKEASNHLAFIRELPCVITGKMPVHAAHIRYGDLTKGKRETGIGEKPDDRWAVPLSPEMHTDGPEAQHAGGEREFWARHGIDPLAVAMALWGVSGDHDAARVILAHARGGRR